MVFLVNASSYFLQNVILSLFKLFCAKIAVFRGGHNCCNKFRDN